MRDGSALRVYHPETSSLFSLALTGITCPRVNTGAPSLAPTMPPPPPGGDDGDSSSASAPAAPANSSQPEPFAREARHFVEMRLLNREVGGRCRSTKR